MPRDSPSRIFLAAVLLSQRGGLLSLQRVLLVCTAVLVSLRRVSATCATLGLGVRLREKCFSASEANFSACEGYCAVSSYRAVSCTCVSNVLVCRMCRSRGTHSVARKYICRCNFWLAPAFAKLSPHLLHCSRGTGCSAFAAPAACVACCGTTSARFPSAVRGARTFSVCGSVSPLCIETRGAVALLPSTRRYP